MKIKSRGDAPRLEINEAELKKEALQKPISRVKQAEAARVKARKRLRQSVDSIDARSSNSYHAEAPDAKSAAAQSASVKRIQRQHSTEFVKRLNTEPASKSSVLKSAAPESIQSRLHSVSELETPRSRLKSGAAGQVIRRELHKQIEQDEADNTGLQAAHTLERSGETALYTSSQLREARTSYHLKQAVRAEQRVDRANTHFLQKQQEIEQPKSGSNPSSRAHQKKAIKKEYMKAKAGKATSRTAASRSAQKAARKSEKAAGSILKKKGTWLVLGLAGLLAVVMNMLSSCTPLVEASLQAIVMGTYPAEEADVKAAERAYRDMEKELEREMEDYERYHPGYDEYIVDADDIWHDPYALIALISAYHGGEEWTIDSAYLTIEMLYEWQYVVDESVTTETRYRTEEQEGTRTVTDPVTGQPYTEIYTYDASVPYTYSTCTVTLENKNLSHAPVYIISREKVGLYAMYMSTLGNMPGLFTGAHASTLKDPLEYDVPQELLDADPKFALLVEEANKRLGYPYVWGGYDPETSFDCSGFISWLFTSTGINNIGHMGATTLYGYSDHVAPHEAKPGDVIFFEGTMGDDVGGITHCGLYVGNNMMVHCGNPCSYADLTESYWVEHFYGFGRLYD